MTLTEAQREYLKRSNLIFNDYLDDSKSLKVANMYINIIGKIEIELDYIMDDLVMGGIDNTERGFHNLVDLCMIYKLNFFQLLDYLIFLSVPMTRIMHKLIIEEYPKVKDSFNYIFEEDFPLFQKERIKENLEEFFEQPNEDERLIFKLIPNFIKQEAMETTVKMVKTKIKNMKIGKIDDYDLTKFIIKDEELNDFNTHADYLEEIFHNDKINSRLYTNSYPHFLNKLSTDCLIYSKDYDSFHFDKLEESLSLGYTQKGLLLNINKKTALKQLEQLLDGFSLLRDEDIEQKKVYLKELINLIREQKYSNYLPFKKIGKALGMTKNEARNYAKKILTSVNHNVFDNYYEA